MSILSFFKSKPTPTVAGLHRITQFDESSKSHVQTPQGCKAFGFQVGYNKALDFYLQHGMIPEPNLSIIKLTHWTKYIEFGQVEGYNQAVRDLFNQEKNL
jgi:hypothetical protein